MRPDAKTIAQFVRRKVVVLQRKAGAAEVLVVPARDGRLDAVRAVLRDLEVQELPFPADSAVRLAQLRASTGLTTPDCCVLLAAEDAGACVASFDDRLVKAAEARELKVLRGGIA